ncbi:MAG: PKD domain-containing protein [Bacteroidales bacterium]|nr:PKD domain-containing protein [Bacteroidales bacterium]
MSTSISHLLGLTRQYYTMNLNTLPFFREVNSYRRSNAISLKVLGLSIILFAFTLLFPFSNAYSSIIPNLGLHSQSGPASNNPPVTYNETVSLCEGSLYAGSILNGDYDPEGSPLVTGIIAQPSHGSVTIDATGNYIYTPVPFYFGVDQVIFSICDGTAPDALCSNDTLFLTIDAFIQSSAGNDQEICSLASTILQGNSAYPGTGSWNLISGFNVPLITMISPSAAEVTGLIPNQTAYLFEYLVSNGACESRDTMQVVNYLAPSTSFAGYDQYICSAIPATLTMGANTPSIGSGHWTYIFGPGPVNIINLNDPNTEMTGLIAGTYLFDWTIQNGNCDASSSAVFIQVTEQPNVFAGNDTTICPGQSFVSLSTSLANAYLDIDWSTSGSGTFDNPEALHPAYFPSADDLEIGMVILSLNASGNFPCGSVTDEMALYFGGNINVNAGPDDFLAPGQTAYLLGNATSSTGLAVIWSSDGDGSFDDPTLLNTTYFPGVNDAINGNIILTLSSNDPDACIFVSDDMQLQYVNGVYVNAGTDASSCGDSYTITTASAGNYSSFYWSHDGLGNLTNNNGLNPIYHPATDESGPVNITLSAIGQSPATDTVSDKMILTIAYPKARISGSSSICQDDSATLRFELEGIAPWNLTYTDGITISEIKDITQTPLLIKVKPIADHKEYTLLSIADAHCQANMTHVSGLALITILPAPVAQFGSQDECSGIPVHFQDISGPNNLIAWNWNFGDMASGIENTSNLQNPQHLYSQAGTYHVQLNITDINGCNAQINNNVNILSTPASSYSFSTHQGNHKVDFKVEGNTPSTLIENYTWYFGDGEQLTISPTQSEITHVYENSGNYTSQLLVSGENGCSGQSTQIVQVGVVPTLELVLNNNNACQQSEVTASVSYTGTYSSWIIEWGDGTAPGMESAHQTSASHIYEIPGSYNIVARIITTDFPMIVTDSISFQINIFPKPNADFSSENHCLGEETIFTNLSVSEGLGADSYSWIFGESGSTMNTSHLQEVSFRYATPGNHEAILTATNSYGCVDTIQRNIEIVLPPSASFSSDASCVGQSIHLYDQSKKGNADLNSWYWEIGGNNQTFSSTLQNPEFVLTEEGNYNLKLSISDEKGCTSKFDSTLKVSGFPMSVFNIEENYGHEQGRVKFSNGSIGGTSYYWDFGNGFTSTEAAPISNFYEDGNYTIRLVTANSSGCSDTAVMSYQQLFKGLYVPNVFSPGHTDALVGNWQPKGEKLASYRVEVYNRWQELQWSSDKLDENGSPSESWDGTFKGVPCQPGIYIWRIQATFIDGTTWQNQDIGNRENMPNLDLGTITLIR